MSFFLKKTVIKDRIYLQISQSFYDPKKKTSSNRVYEKIGYLDKLIEQGIDDPIATYTKKIEKLNKAHREIIEKEKREKISENNSKNFGYFLIKAMFNTLGLQTELGAMDFFFKGKYPISNLIEALTYCRCILPCSKKKTFESVMPAMYENYDLSLDQIYDGLEFVGQYYSDFIELLNVRINDIFKRNTKHTFFDCTNYYFEIDYPKEDKQKGPSKENRHDPIIGQALLLDADSIPLAMRMFPGNESEKPKIRELIKQMKKQNSIIGKTIQIADKGLNCGQNIYEALINGDGYIFSQSVQMLEQKEQLWVTLSNDYKDVCDENGELLYKYKSCIDEFPITVKDENGNNVKINVTQKRVATFNPKLYKKKKLEIQRLVEKAQGNLNKSFKKEDYGECGKYLIFTDEAGKTVSPKFNVEKIKKDLDLAGYNVLITSEIKMTPKEIYSAYHNLWKIENCFRTLKTELDARPVYLQNKHKIYGHFLICYYALTMLRLLEEKVFKNLFGASEILEMVKELNCHIYNGSIYNGTNYTENLNKLNEFLDSIITNRRLYDRELKHIFKLKYSTKINKLH